MKKAVKSLIIAASVAAIAGIGAVSFAAWEAGTPTDATANGATGSINVTAGEIKVTGNNITDSVKLLPYDQEDQVGSNVTMQTFTVAYDAGTDGAPASSYTFTMSLTNTNNLTLYYKLGTVADTPEDLTGWTEWTQDVTLDLSSDQVVNIVLDSDDVTEMNKAYSITISADLAA